MIPIYYIAGGAMFVYGVVSLIEHFKKPDDRRKGSLALAVCTILFGLALAFSGYRMF